MDPFLDESVTMAKRLKSLGRNVGLDILSGLPHGFLTFHKVIMPLKCVEPIELSSSNR